MKNLFSYCLITLFIGLFSVQQARGQAALLVLLLGDKVATENFHFSLDAGVNLAYMPSLAGKPAVQPNFGLGIHLKMNHHWHFAPEFKPLSRKGQRDVERIIEVPADLEGTINASKTSLRFNYIEVPLLFQYRPGARWYFSAGPQISFLNKAEYVTDATFDNGDTIELVEDTKPDMKKVDYSFPVEVAYIVSEARNGKGLDFRLRFTPGFTNVFSESINASARNSAVQVIVTFPFIESEDE